MDFDEILDILAGFLECEGFRFAAIGAFGLHANGLSRATIDLDLAMEEATQPRLVPFLEHLMLDRDLPTTADDVVALQRTRAARRIPLEAYLAFLARLGSPGSATLRLRRGRWALRSVWRR